MKPLPPPEDAIDHDKAIEVLRGWIVGGDLQVTLAFEVFGKEVETWGQLLAETVSHLADALSAQGYGAREAMFARIQASLLDHLAKPYAGLQGSVRGPAQ
jgi:hypothetical protein